MEARSRVARVTSLLIFVLTLSGFIIETHSLPNAHSLLPLQLYLLCCSSRSLHSYFLIQTRSLPALARCYPCSFTFYAWHAVASAKAGRSSHLLHSYFVHGIRSRILSVIDPLQRSRLKIQFAFCLGIRYASHLSPVVNRIRTTIPFQSILN